MYLDKTSKPVNAMLFEATLAVAQGLLANGAINNSPEFVARRSVEIAKELINELAKLERG